MHRPTRDQSPKGKIPQRWLYHLGVRRGTADAKSGIHYNTNNPGLPLLLSLQTGPQPSALVERYLQELVAAPEAQQRLYLNAFAAGYKEGMRRQGKPPVIPVLVLPAPRLTDIGIALLQYMMDHNETLPPMATSEDMEKALRRYVADTRTFIDPISGLLYLPNPALSGAHLAAVANPASAVCAYQPIIGRDGRRAVLFLDGNVRKVTKAGWGKLRQQMEMPQR